MDFQKEKGFLLKLALFYWVIAIMVYAVAKDQFHYTIVKNETLSPTSVVDELVDGHVITQRMIAPADQLTGVELMVATYGRTNPGTLSIHLNNEDGETVAQQSVELSVFPDSQYVTIPLTQTGTIRYGESLTLVLTPQGCMPGNSIAPYYGNTITTGRFDVVQTIAPEDRYSINAEIGLGMLCVRLNGIRTLTFYQMYWWLILGLFAAICIYLYVAFQKAKQGRSSALAVACTLVFKYRFLLKQLVTRDFKIKYKRSVLGIGWSFLNPLLTMLVQYVIFSTLFQADIPNFPVYLLSGTVFFSFFNEAVSMGMTSITGNAALIKKVYMPKYIYPISKLLSSLINFLITLIPLILVMMITGAMPHLSMLLLVFDILCVIGFVLGMIMLLSSAMTFFQDTQFLWSVVSMLWMYLTPLFYPESIIPRNFLTLYHMNPMYQYITFARICIIDGVSPEPMAYFWCVLSSVVVLGLGLLVFKKNQDKFVMYL